MYYLHSPAGGVVFVVNLFIPTDGPPLSPALPFPAPVLVSILGYIATSATFSTIYILTYGLFPTTHRGRVFSVCQVAARIGSYVSSGLTVHRPKSR